MMNFMNQKEMKDEKKNIQPENDNAPKIKLKSKNLYVFLETKRRHWLFSKQKNHSVFLNSKWTEKKIIFIS